MDAKYEKVKRTLRQEIRDGRFVAGQKFPSDAQLMRRFGVSRATVLRAVEELVRGGILCRRRGSGTYVSSRVRYGRIGLLIHGSDYCEFFAPFARRVSHLCQRRSLTLLFAGPHDGAPALRRAGRTCVRAAGIAAEESVNPAAAGFPLRAAGGAGEWRHCGVCRMNM